MKLKNIKVCNEIPSFCSDDCECFFGEVERKNVNTDGQRETILSLKCIYQRVCGEIINGGGEKKTGAETGEKKATPAGMPRR